LKGSSSSREFGRRKATHGYLFPFEHPVVSSSPISASGNDEGGKYYLYLELRPSFNMTLDWPERGRNVTRFISQKSLESR
jgi:hypothetical protein